MFTEEQKDKSVQSVAKETYLDLTMVGAKSLE